MSGRLVKPAPAPIKPVKLQLNRRGSWMTVAEFDAADEAEADAVMSATIVLALFSGGSWRICVNDGLDEVLMRLEEPVLGWQAAGHGAQR